VRHLARAIVVLSLTALALVPVGTQSADQIAGKVTKLDGGAPLPGAVVTLAGPNQAPITATTGGDGGYSINTTGSGPYSIGVQAQGYAAQSVPGAAPGQDFALERASFIPLPIDSGFPWSVAADAASGIFYSVISQAPEVYRTLDHGGTWQPVTMGYDSPSTGLNRSAGSDTVATSSVAGEVAVVTGGFNGRLSYSTDFGLTWRTIGGELPPTPQSPTYAVSTRLFWGHAAPGAPNVLMVVAPQVDGSWTVSRANMDAENPSLVREPADPFGTGSVIAVADSTNGSVVGRLSPAGASSTLAFAPLTATGPISFADDMTDLPGPPVQLRLGGGKEAGSPPDAALVVGGSGTSHTAQILMKPPGTASFASGSRSAPTSLPSECAPGPSEFDKRGSASLAPALDGAEMIASAGNCWLRTAGTGQLVVRSASCCSMGDPVYDASFARGNYVALSSTNKAASLDDQGLPQFIGAGPASPGTAPNSGGLSVRGLTSAVVSDTAYGPAGNNDVAISGGNFRVASKDGGTTITPIGGYASGQYGSTAVQWWQGAAGTGDWLVFGGTQGTDTNLLSAFRRWDPAVPTPSGPNVEGSKPADLGSPGVQGYGIESLQGVPGTDMLFIGLSKRFDTTIVGDSHLYRATLVPGEPPSLTDKFDFGPALGGIPLYTPVAMAYCPADAGDARLRDVLFVATGDAGGNVGIDDLTFGSLLRITGATTGAPNVTEVASVPHGAPRTSLTDVRADCGRGVVYAAAGNGVHRSADGGNTFTKVADPGTLGGFAFALAIDPANPDKLTVSAGFQGAILNSPDAGATWNTVNDPGTGRQQSVVDIEYPPGGGAPRIFGARARAAAVAPPEIALLGTGGGAFLTEVGVANGVIAMTRAQSGSGGSGAPWRGTKVTGLAADAEPALASDPRNANPTTVFRRPNGLGLASQVNQTWSPAEPVPATQAGDDKPAAAIDRTGRLVVAFRRTGGPAPGIYVTTRTANGTWTPLQLVAKKVGTSPVALAVTAGRAPRIHLVFLRSRGRSAGIWYATDRTGRWKSTKVPRTTRADARVVLGMPALAADGLGRIHLAFVRGGGKRGIRYAVLTKKRWSKLKRMTKNARDRDPLLAVPEFGAATLVFRRAARKGPRSFLTLDVDSRQLRRVTGTTAADGQADVALDTLLRLTFVRRGGPSPGLYYTERNLNEKWYRVPERRTTTATDSHPRIRSTGGRPTLVFERG